MNKIFEQNYYLFVLLCAFGGKS